MAVSSEAARLRSSSEDEGPGRSRVSTTKSRSAKSTVWSSVGRAMAMDAKATAVKMDAEKRMLKECR